MVEKQQTLAEFFGVERLDFGSKAKAELRATTVHLVIDVQREFCDKSYYKRGSDITEVISSHLAQNIVPQLRHAGLKTIFVYTVGFGQDYRKPEECGGGFHKVRPVKGDQVSYKTKHSAFKGTDLARRLKSMGIKNLIISGFNAKACVRSTVFSALKEEFNVCVLRDGIANDLWNTGDINGHVQDMKQKGAFVCASDRAIKTFS